MADIQRRGGPQLASLLRRFGVQKRPPESQIYPDILPVAQVPRLDNLCGGTKRVTALAANRSLVQLFNPSGSGVVVVLHKLWISLGAAGRVSIRTHNIALADAATALGVLNRIRGNQSEPSAQMRSLQGTSIGNDILAWPLDVVDKPYEFNVQRMDDSQEFFGPSLSEGAGFTVTPSSDNVELSVSFLWSERIVQD